MILRHAGLVVLLTANALAGCNSRPEVVAAAAAPPRRVGTPPMPVESLLRGLAPGWTSAMYASGDLDGDGIADVASIFTKGEEATLRIYVGTADGSLVQKTEAPKAVCVRCGGASAADVPFTLTIASRVLSLTYAGGSRERFTTTTKWRLQGGEFFLIGVDDGMIDTIADTKGDVLWTAVDANISTMKMTQKTARAKSSSQDRGPGSETVTTTSCSVPPSFAKITLPTFDLDAFTAPS